MGRSHLLMCSMLLDAAPVACRPAVARDAFRVIQCTVQTRTARAPRCI